MKTQFSMCSNSQKDFRVTLKIESSWRLKSIIVYVCFDESRIETRRDQNVLVIISELMLLSFSLHRPANKSLIPLMNWLKLQKLDCTKVIEEMWPWTHMVASLGAQLSHPCVIRDRSWDHRRCVLESSWIFELNYTIRFCWFYLINSFFVQGNGE